MKKKKDEFKTLVVLLGNIWLITWFGAIWIKSYRIELFLTGLFCLVLAVILRMD